MFIGIGIALMSMILPKTALSLVAGAMFGTAVGASLMFIIASVAAAMNYFIGRWWLYRSIQIRICKEESGSILKAVSQVGRDAGFGLHFLIRLAPIPTMLISYTMGAVGARFGPFLLAAIVGGVPQILWVHSGSVMSDVGAANQNLLRLISGIVALGVGITISVIVPKLVSSRIKMTSHQTDSEEMGDTSYSD